MRGLVPEERPEDQLIKRLVGSNRPERCVEMHRRGPRNKMSVSGPRHRGHVNADIQYLDQQKEAAQTDHCHMRQNRIERVRQANEYQPE